MFGHLSLDRYLITRVLTTCHVKNTKSTHHSVRAKAFDFRSLSPALRDLRLLLVVIIIVIIIIVIIIIIIIIITTITFQERKGKV